jgi:hypothetical protein
VTVRYGCCSYGTQLDMSRLRRRFSCILFFFFDGDYFHSDAVNTVAAYTSIDGWVYIFNSESAQLSLYGTEVEK